MILNAIATHASMQPHRVALQGATSSFTYAELSSELNKLSARFASRKPKLLGIVMENSPAWAITDLAAVQNNIPTVPLPLFFSAEQIAHAIHDSGIDMLITDQPIFLEQILSIQKISFQEKQEHLAGDKVVAIFNLKSSHATTLPEGTAKITYTSGTTDKPKGVCLSAQTMETVAMSLLQATEAKSTDHHLSILPLSTLLENLAGLYVPLLAGAKITLLPAKAVGHVGSTGFDVPTFMHAIANSQASSMILTPELLYALVSVIEAGFELPQHLRFIAVGGASVSPQLLERAKIIGLPVFEGYGLSECASVVALNTTKANKTGSVGRPLAHIDIRIAEDGEVLTRGASLLGYVGARPYVSRGFLPTGDIGYLDQDGFLYISGRKKNIFITSFGRNVSPEWVERELTFSPAIKQAAVFGEARPWNTAVIVPAPKADKGSVQAAIDAANQNLPDYAKVSQWILADTPFTPHNGLLTNNGRIRREAIWQHYQPVINPLYKEPSNAVL